jgi:heat-inducible transcriptional repressor
MARIRDHQLTQRQRRIIRAVVAQHIRTAQPVGSKAVCETPGFDCSPATIRNEMVRLEQKGYLHQPHTSAGRAPLEPAYRLYVDGLMRSRTRLDRQMTWMQGEIRRLAAEPEAALQRTSGLLSQTTKYPAVVTRPQETSPRLTKLSLAPISAHNVRLSYVDDQGSAAETLIETQAPVKVSDVHALERALRRALLGRPLTAAPELGQAPAADPGMLSAIRSALEESVSGRVYVEGAAYMLDQPEFAQIDRLRRVMKTLTHSPLLRRLLHATAGPGRVSVTIGNEHGVEPLSDCSVVAASYSLPGRSQPGGTVGVVGPMRMDYRLAMAAVGCVARELGAALARARGG